METWALWYPKAAATGLLHSRCRLDRFEVVLAHAVPEELTVEIFDEAGHQIAFSADLPRTQQSPIARLRRSGDTVTREDIWPADEDLGLPVLLPGGEVGILKAWWHAEDRKEWRWQVELYNSIR